MCLNDGNKTLINIRTGKESVLDLTLVSNNFASVWDWRVYKDGTTGSDHYPVICNISSGKNRWKRRNWVFEKADWEKFQAESDTYLSQIANYIDLELLNNEIKPRNIIIGNRNYT